MPLQPSGRFGSALAVLDFNRDGVPDLAVGAPSVGSEKLTYTVRLLPQAESGRGEGEAGPGRASVESRQPNVPSQHLWEMISGPPVWALDVTLGYLEAHSSCLPWSLLGLLGFRIPPEILLPPSPPLPRC